MKIDPLRAEWLKERRISGTGFYIRAVDEDGAFQSVDVVVLTAESLLEWLHSRGGVNNYAERFVMALLEYSSREIDAAIEKEKL